MKKEDTSAWKTIKKEDPVDLKLFRAHFEYLHNPRNEKEVKIVRLSGPDACNVVAIAEDGSFLLVKQLRFGTQSYTLEVPGGLMEQGEDQRISAQREMMEETGYTSTEWQYLSSVPSNPVYLDCHIHHWLARDIRLTDTTQMDDAEDLEIVFFSLEEILLAIKTGEINHPHTISAFMAYFMSEESPVRILI